MDGIRSRFILKDNKVEEPTDYLGAQLSKTKDEFGNEFWTMSSSKYCKATIKNVEERLALAGKRLPTKCKTPMVTKYAPDMDVTAELKADGIHYFQELIGVLRWACEIGRVYILIEISLLLTHLASPRIGHLEQVSIFLDISRKVQSASWDFILATQRLTSIDSISLTGRISTKL